MSKRLLALLGCAFVVMIGLGITMPVLPFYSERLALAGGASFRSLPIHIALLTSIYALAQFIFAPVWGRWSDRIGRRWLLLIGIGGSAAAMILFGVSTSLRMLYIARVIGGILSSATLPADRLLSVNSTPKPTSSPHPCGRLVPDGGNHSAQKRKRRPEADRRLELGKSSSGGRTCTETLREAFQQYHLWPSRGS